MNNRYFRIRKNQKIVILKFVALVLIIISYNNPKPWA